LFGGYGQRSFVPLAFILVAVVAAARWGSLGALLGLVASAMLFALFLFSPIGSLHVNADVARRNLGWMLLLGLPSAYFFAKPPGPKNPRARK
jgi:integral membrane sensor domain MASE1